MRLPPYEHTNVLLNDSAKYQCTPRNRETILSLFSSGASQFLLAQKGY